MSMAVGAELVRRAQRGDTFALDLLVRQLTPYIGRICGAIAVDRGDDAMQEAMFAIVRNLTTLREPEAVRGWARRIAVREAVRVARGGHSIPVDPVVLDINADVRDDGTAAVDVRSVLTSLPPEQRAVLVLRHIDGLGEEEMAEVLQVAVGTVKSRLNRARAAFRARWSS
jgi:RNA polymerase sigma factor (sigma-70 family)